VSLFRDAFSSGGATVKIFSGAKIRSTIRGVVYRLGVEKKYSLDRSVTGNTILLSALYSK
jgi:hypothetical protein